MTRRFLVTGGAGYVGSHVVAALTDRGDAVVVIDNHIEPPSNNLGCKRARMAIVRLHKSPASEVFCTCRGAMTASPDFSFPDYPERDPRELRIHHMEQVLRKAAGFFRAVGSNTMARECEELLQPLSATRGPSH